MAVTKKTGSAVVRNRVKRVLRECFRIHQMLLPSALDIVIVPKRHFNPKQFTLAVATRELLPVLEDLRVYAASCCDAQAEPSSPDRAVMHREDAASSGVSA